MSNIDYPRSDTSNMYLAWQALERGGEGRADFVRALSAWESVERERREKGRLAN